MVVHLLRADEDTVKVKKKNTGVFVDALSFTSRPDAVHLSTAAPVSRLQPVRARFALHRGGD